jgi:CRP-like cAMP-binding protein
VSPTRIAPAGNRLLDRLSTSIRRRILAGCELVELAFADVLYTPGKRLTHVYFPVRGFISLVMPVGGASSLEVGLIGNEGMFGIPLALGVDVSPVRAVVQGSGSAWRMDAARFCRELKQSPALQRQIDRYVFVHLGQLAQTAGCTRFHVVEARLARWLLMTQDRAQADAFHITQQFLALMLGVRRVGVTKAASALQKRKLIHYSRGNITVLDRPGLRVASCLCYAADRETYDRVLG